MPEPLAADEIDVRLTPFLQAIDDAEAECQLARLLADEAEPIIRGVIRRKLGFALDRAGRGVLGQDDEDLFSEIRLLIIKRLQALKSQPGLRPINNFSNYVAVTAYNACYEYLRQKYPRRWQLKSRLHYLLSRRSEFGLWPINDRELVAGFADWREHGLLDSEKVRALAEDSGLAALRANIAALLVELFRRAGAPIELDTLVDTVCAITGMTDVRPGDEEEVAVIADPAAGADIVVEQRLFLQRLWTEICQLRPRQRAALLLNLRDAEGASALTLLPITGIADMQQIAHVLEISVEALAAIWSDLPLDDNAIAARLALSRQQVINLRKSARERLERRLRDYK